MKKRKALLLAAMIAVSTLSGCDESTPSSGYQTVLDSTDNGQITSQVKPDKSKSDYPEMFDILPEIPITDVSEFEYKYDSERGGIAVTNYTGSSLRVRVPDTIDGEPVVSVYTGKTAITQLIVPDTVQIMECNNDNLKYANIPASYINHIYNCFIDAKKLEKIYFSDKITSIGHEFCIGCSSLTEVIIPDSVTKAKSTAFKRAFKIIITYKGKQYDYESIDEFNHAVNGTTPSEGAAAPG